MEIVNDISSKIFFVFNLICVLAAIILTSYWIYVFTLNEDLVAVDYKKYYGGAKDVFPVLSICIRNSLSDEKLKKINPNINTSVYLDFLKGHQFEQNMLQINYPTIVQNITDFVAEDFVRYRDGRSVALHPDYHDDSSFGEHVAINNRKRVFSSNYAFFYFSFFYNCYDLSVPQNKSIHEFWFRVNSSIFTSGVRPTIHGFMTLLHYPNQLLIASNKNYQWPETRTKADSYGMMFHITGVEVLKRRQKRDRPCNENWEDHDKYIKKHQSAAMGCRLPYIGDVENVPLCTTKKQMKKKFFYQEDDYGVNPPC